MNTTVTLDEADRVIIPQELRGALHLNAGDALALETEGERIILCPVHPTGAMQQERGIWVFRSGHSLDANVTDEALDRVRQKRDLGNEGVIR